MKTSKLSGKRVLVTSGAQGIGLAISYALLREGCDVFVHYFSSDLAAKDFVDEAKAAGRVAGCSRADLTVDDEMRSLVADAVAQLGGIDILVNNAGALVARRSFAETDATHWSAVMAVNLGSAYGVSRAALPHLVDAARTRGGAAIINISSLAGRKGGGAGSSAYSAAKGAMLTLTRGLATELGPQGIRVNAIAPGLILGSKFHATHTTAEAVKETVASIPLRRGGNPEDVARTVVFLASEFDGFISGATIDVNGGVYSC